jgi:large subunit ribosomal protein L7/L12
MTPERLAAVALPLAAILTLVLLALLARVSRLARENRELRKKLADLAAGGAWPTAAVLQATKEALAGTHVLPADVQARVHRLLIEGRTIEAIKAYRESTRLGLKESKDAIDALRRTLGV